MVLVMVLLIMIMDNGYGNTCNVQSMGAIGDGRTDNTRVFRQGTLPSPSPPSPLPLHPLWLTIPPPIEAFGLCNTVVVPNGSYLTGPLNVTTNSFTLQLIGTMVASTSTTQWPVMPHLPSYPCDRDICSCCRYQPFILAYNVSNFTITGPGSGVVDGQGATWWAKFRAHPRQISYGRPRLLETMYAYNVVVSNVEFKDSPFWTTHYWASDTVLIDNVTVIAPLDSPNTDGFDPDSTTNVHIRNSYVRNGDDCVAIKSGMNSAGIQFGRPSGNILIENLRCAGHPISIGSEMSGGVFNVTVRNIPLAEALYIKTAVGRGGYVRDVVFGPSIKLLGGQLLRIRTDYDHLPGQKALPVIKNIHYDGIEGVGAQAGDFSCTKDIPCTNITLARVKLAAPLGFSCSNVTGSSSDTHPKFCV